MRNRIISGLTVALATVSLLLTACEDEVSGIGGSISSSEVAISLDSLRYDLKGHTVAAPALESRSAYLLLGSVRVPEYGSLDCSYVTQFLPSETLNVPDTITAENVDSVKLILTVPKNYITGDSVAPQQMRVYSLTKQLPADISSNFDPTGYYDSSSPLASKSYTLSGYSYTDTTFVNKATVSIRAKLPVEFGKDVFNAYKTDPDIFVWPQKFAEYWPGIFVEPSFGKGCIAPVQSTSIYAYFPKTVQSAQTDSDGNATIVTQQKADSVCLFTTAPEVLSSVNIDYEPSDKLKNMVAQGKSIITTPGGYTVSFRFPAEEILEDYWEEKYDMGVINNMKFSIPARLIPNDYGIGLPPALVMVKTSELDEFFSDGRLPDNKTSFYSLFSSDNYTYPFSSMREYIVNLKAKGKDNITDDDVEFTLVPVTLSTEDYTDVQTGSVMTAVTALTPYIIMPTMMELDTENALVVFTYSNQTLN
ncbi:MAG: DUF4270 family protein [Muribaculaceae bacterium]|nr:DUF4270 family protein [Muribaculaceae bacterium]